MLEKFKVEQQPIKFECEYDLQNGIGFATFDLGSEKEYLSKFDAEYGRMFNHYRHYMYAMYGVDIIYDNTQSESVPGESITFKNNIIIVNLNLGKQLHTNVILDIYDKDTFLHFLSMFTDTDYTIKFCKTHRIWKPISDPSKGCGIEVEINSPKTPEERRNLIKNLKNKFGDFVYCETEATLEFPIEITTNIVNLNELKKVYDVVEFMINNGCEIAPISNIHIHVAKDFFGKTQNEILESLHKILFVEYYHGKNEKFINSEGRKIISYIDDLCQRYNLDIKDNNFMTKLSSYFHDKKITPEVVYPRIDYFKYLRDPDEYHSIEFKWLSLKDRKTFEEAVDLLFQYLNLCSLSFEDIYKLNLDDYFNNIKIRNI